MVISARVVVPFSIAAWPASSSAFLLVSFLVYTFTFFTLYFTLLNLTLLYFKFSSIHLALLAKILFFLISDYWLVWSYSYSPFCVLLFSYFRVSFVFYMSILSLSCDKQSVSVSYLCGFLMSCVLGPVWDSFPNK